MTDITSITEIPDGDDLSEAQMKAIVNRIDVIIFNVLAGKWDLVPYAEFGEAGHRKDPDKMIAALKSLREMWVLKMRELPFNGISVLDDPDY